jgi:hypothetical protein
LTGPASFIDHAGMVFRAVAWIMVVVFLLSVIVQYNDPDPIPWMAMYGAAMILTLWYAVRPPGGPSALSLVVFAIAAAWSLRLASTVWGRVPLAEIFATAGMKTEAIEVARESVGLAIVAGWMLLLVAVRRRLATHAPRR